MANFEQAVDVVLANEGGYANDPHDHGGETFRGVSRGNFPNWPGWALIDQEKAALGFERRLIANAALTALVREFYRHEFWVQHHLESIASQAIANKVFDMAVNMGPWPAIRILQRALEYFKVGPIVADGKIGPFTATAAGKIPDARLLPELRARYAQFHAGLANDPKYAVYLLGWLRRDVQ